MSIVPFLRAVHHTMGQIHPGWGQLGVDQQFNLLQRGGEMRRLVASYPAAPRHPLGHLDEVMAFHNLLRGSPVGEGDPLYLPKDLRDAYARYHTHPTARTRWDYFGTVSRLFQQHWFAIPMSNFQGFLVDPGKAPEAFYDAAVTFEDSFEEAKDSLESLRALEERCGLQNLGLLQLEKLEGSYQRLGDGTDLVRIQGARYSSRFAHLHRAIREIVAYRQDFDARLKGASDSVVKLKAFEASLEFRLLTATQLTMLLHAYKDLGSWEDVARLYERSKNTRFRGSDVIREFYIVALNKLGRLDESIAQAEAYVADGLVNGEVLSGLGAAYKTKHRAAKKATTNPKDYLRYFPDDPDLTRVSENSRAALEKSLVYYERAFQADYEYYPGVNVVYSLIALGRNEEAERIAPLVYLACIKAGAEHSKDYWDVVTLLEFAAIARKSDEMRAMLPKVLRVAKAEWEIETTLNSLRGMREQRIGETDHISILDEVIAAMTARAGQLVALQLQSELASIKGRDVKGTLEKVRAKYLQYFPGDPKCEQVAANAKREVALPSPSNESLPPELSQKREVTDFIHTNSFHMRGLRSNWLGGNIPWGGNLNDHVVSRVDLRDARLILEKTGLKSLSDPLEFNRAVDLYIENQFRLRDPASGHRVLEDLRGRRHHEVFDAYMDLIKRFTLTSLSRDSRTNLVTDLAIGIGDCRPTHYLKQLLFDTWKNDSINTLMAHAYEAAKSGDTALHEAAIGQIRALEQVQLLTFRVEIWGNVQTDGKYKIKKDRLGRFQHSPTANLLEEHTQTYLAYYDDRSLIDRLICVDTWYQEEYPWGFHEVNAFDLAPEGPGASGGSQEAFDTEGDAYAANIRLRFAPYASSQFLPNADEYGQSRWQNLTVEPPSPEMAAAIYLGDRRHLDVLLMTLFGIDVRLGKKVSNKSAAQPRTPERGRERDMGVVVDFSAHRAATVGSANAVLVRPASVLSLHADLTRIFDGNGPALQRLERLVKPLERVRVPTDLPSTVRLFAMKNDAYQPLSPADVGYVSSLVWQRVDESRWTPAVLATTLRELNVTAGILRARLVALIGATLAVETDGPEQTRDLIDRALRFASMSGHDVTGFKELLLNRPDVSLETGLMILHSLNVAHHNFQQFVQIREEVQRNLATFETQNPGRSFDRPLGQIAEQTHNDWDDQEQKGAAYVAMTPDLHDFLCRMVELGVIKKMSKDKGKPVTVDLLQKAGAKWKVVAADFEFTDDAQAAAIKEEFGRITGKDFDGKWLVNSLYARYRHLLVVGNPHLTPADQQAYMVNPPSVSLSAEAEGWMRDRSTFMFGLQSDSVAAILYGLNQPALVASLAEGTDEERLQSLVEVLRIINCAWRIHNPWNTNSSPLMSTPFALDEDGGVGIDNILRDAVVLKTVLERLEYYRQAGGIVLDEGMERSLRLAFEKDLASVLDKMMDKATLEAAVRENTQVYEALAAAAA